MKNFIYKVTKDIFSVEMLLYMAFGTGTAIIDVGLYYLCYNYLPIKSILLTSLSNSIAWVASTLFAFITNKMFVFKYRNTGKRKSMYEMIKFFAARVFSLGFSIIMLIVLIDMMGKNAMIAKLLASIVVIILNYIASKTFIFANDDE